MTPKLDPQVMVGAVSLSVADLERSLAYYQNGIGLRLQERANGTAVLGAGSTPLVRLHEQPGTRPYQRVTGLYHFAILLPTRRELAQTIQHLAETNTSISGAADHLASEALYLSDPDGHGIEIYRDRPREGWYDAQGYLKMDTLRLDYEGIMAELADGDQPWEGLSAEAVMGHMHLHVAHLQTAVDFYMGIIGLERPSLKINFPSAAFLGVGGYHHHLGLNTWAGVGAPPPPPDAAHLLSYEILFPNKEALQPVLKRLAEANIPSQTSDDGWLVQDPSFNRMLLRTV